MTDVKPSTPTAAAAPSPAPGRRRWLLVLLLIPLAAAGYFGWRAVQVPHTPFSRELADHSVLQLNLEQPDALIESQALSQLPRDLLQIPLLRDLLSEDFVFYYESNADRLGVAGSLRRIAYEHKLQWRDSLISELLDAPAEIALWRAGDGKLGHALLRIRAGGLVKLLPALAAVSSNDTQLSQVGALQVEGEAVAVYRLRYNFDRAILFAVHNEQLLLLTSPGLLQSSEDAASAIGRAQAEQLDRLLAGGDALIQQFRLGALDSRHRLSLRAEYLAMGYGRFVPQLAGLRLQLDGTGWSSHVAVSNLADGELQFESLWQAMPIGASACVAVPVSASAMQSLLARLNSADMLPATLLPAFAGPAALCWYPNSRLNTPLLVTRLQTPAANPNVDLDAGLRRGFEQLIGAYEANVEGGKFAIEEQATAAGKRWQRVVGSRWGLHADTELPDAGALQSDRFFRVGLARHNETLLFSLDDALLTQAIATLEQRYPPLAEQLPSGRVPLYVAPATLAKLIEQETLRSLPGDVEAVFRNAAQAHLLPKLRSLAAHPPYALSLPTPPRASGDWTWLPISWTAL